MRRTTGWSARAARPNPESATGERERQNAKQRREAAASPGVAARSRYGLNRIWRPPIEKAGHALEDRPRTGTTFMISSAEIARTGYAHVYAIGLRMNNFLTAHGGRDLVTRDGRLRVEDPEAAAAVLEVLTCATTACKGGFVAPGAIGWNEADDNSATHVKQIAIDVNGRVSTEAGIYREPSGWDDVATIGRRSTIAGRRRRAGQPNACGPAPERAKNVAPRKEFVRYFIRPLAEDRMRPEDPVHAGRRGGRPVLPRTGCARPDRGQSPDL